MADPFRKHGRWYLKYKDAHGEWLSESTQCRTKAEAKNLQKEVERKVERQRLGLEVLPTESDETLADMMKWWLETYVSKTSSTSASTRAMVVSHIIGHDEGWKPVKPGEDVREKKAIAFGKNLASKTTPAIIDAYFADMKARGYKPKTIKHVRSYLSAAYTKALRDGRFACANPVIESECPAIPKRKPDYLQPEEVNPILDALSEKWRNLFATALYTGMRKGELFAIEKSDLDFRRKLIHISKSHDKDAPKGNHEEVIPMATALEPFLQAAVKASPNSLVFPDTDGQRFREDFKLAKMLRTAMRRAGVVEGYSHKCRRKGCGHSELHADSELRTCPQCDFKLWPVAKVRQITFHHLRHTTASLLIMSGASIAATQAILRHTDPKITMELYAHLAPGYLRKEIDVLNFAPAGIPVPAPETPVPAPETPVPVAQNQVQPSRFLVQAPSEKKSSFGPPLVRTSKSITKPQTAKFKNSNKIVGLRATEVKKSNTMSSGFEPAAVDSPDFVHTHEDSQALGNIKLSGIDLPSLPPPDTHPLTRIDEVFGPPLVRESTQSEILLDQIEAVPLVQTSATPDISFVEIEEEDIVHPPMPEPLDLADILASTMAPGWHELPIGKKRRA